MSPARLLRAAVVLLADALALLLLSAVLPGFDLDRPGAALAAAVVVGAMTRSYGRSWRASRCRSAS